MTQTESCSRPSGAAAARQAPLRVKRRCASSAAARQAPLRVKRT
jgi:hypothetical protein